MQRRDTVIICNVCAVLQVRLLVILMQNAEKKEERRERKRR